MIIDSISNIVLQILSSIINLFPTANPDVITFITSNLTTIKNLLININFAIDIITLGKIIVWSMVLEITLLTVHLIQWILANVSVGFYKPTK